ncbi:MAG: metallophosphoesterase [Verrucomicrobiota bacterium]
MKYPTALRRNVEAWPLRRFLSPQTNHSLLRGRHTPALTGGVRAPSRFKPSLRVGLITDVHFADKAPNGLNFYRESRGKFREAIDFFNRQKTDLVVELGDFIDGKGGKDREVEHLRTINGEFQKAQCDTVHVLGNHCLESLTKEEFLDETSGIQPPYSFDRAGFHFIVLDGNFDKEGESYAEGNFRFFDSAIPPSQTSWLEVDLARTNLPSFVFVHQRLDVTKINPFGVRNAAEIRRVLERSGKVISVFQGHSHLNSCRRINGVNYATMRAMVKGGGARNSGYAVAEIYPDSAVVVQGFRKQRTYHLAASRSFL